MPSNYPFSTVPTLVLAGSGYQAQEPGPDEPPDLMEALERTLADLREAGAKR